MRARVTNMVCVVAACVYVQIAHVFKAIDIDGGGTIDAEEVAELVFMNDQDGELTAEAKKVVASCIKEADTDGDGLIDLDEFITLLQMDPTDQLDAYEWRVTPKEEVVEA